jgi:NAD(P)-dependent dehydrogenase (short-subunit alcohol dehydrogenase family)
MKELNNAVAAVTGAASGIGRSLAMNLAKEGCGLALADIAQAGLDQTAEMAKNNGNKVTTHVLDVADREQVYGFADDVAETDGQVILDWTHSDSDNEYRIKYQYTS